MATNKQTRNKSQAELLDQATSQLLKVIKAKAAKSDKTLPKANSSKQG